MKLPQPKVTVQMKVAAILAEKAAKRAAEEQQAAVSTWAQVAIAEPVAVEAAEAEDDEWHDCQDMPEQLDACPCTAQQIKLPQYRHSS